MKSRLFTFLMGTSLFFNVPLFGLLDTLTITGSPAPFVVNTAVAGSQPTRPPDDTSTTYGVLTVLGNKIVGSLNTAMPTGVTLQVQLTAPVLVGGGTSAGFVSMTTTNKDLLTGISLVALSSGNQITYRFSATVNAAIVTNGSRTLTYTLQ